MRRVLGHGWTLQEARGVSGTPVDTVSGRKAAVLDAAMDGRLLQRAMYWDVDHMPIHASRAPF